MFSVANENLSLDVVFLQNLQGVSTLVYLIVTIIASNSLSIRPGISNIRPAGQTRAVE